jgi:DNA-binding NtrC family response regulator
MPARVVVVHNNLDFLESVTAALSTASLDVAAFSDSMRALDALDEPRRIEVLVTSVECGPGKPSGVALARMSLVKRPGIKVIFLGDAEMEAHTAGLGELLAPDTIGVVVAQRVSQMLLPADAKSG